MSAPQVTLAHSVGNYPWAVFLFFLVLLPSTGRAESTETFDRLWESSVLYRDDRNPFLQEFKLRGRYHGQYHEVHSEDGEDTGWEDRRVRFGFDARLLEKKVEVRLDFQISDGFDHIYDGLIDAYIRWKPTPSVNVTMGKLQPLIAYNEWMTPAADFETVERSHMFPQMQINRATGFTVDGNLHGLLWQAGVYSNDTPFTTYDTGRWGEGEFGDFSGGVSYSVGVGYDFKEHFGLSKALFRVDWLHSYREAGDLVFSRYDDIISVSMQLREGRWGLSGEFYRTTGGDLLNEDFYSFYLLPSYELIKGKFQLVGRITYTNGEGLASVKANPRYERETAITPIPGIPGTAGRGNEYRSMYLGSQYFIYGNKLKLMGGAEWAQLLRKGEPTGYDGVMMIAAFRLSF